MIPVKTTNSPIVQNQIRPSLSRMKKIVYSIFIILISALGFGFYLYNKPHRGIGDEQPAFKLKAETLISEYDTDETKSNTKYLGKIVEVKGVIAEKLKDKTGNINITLQGPDLSGIGCQFEPNTQDKLERLSEGQVVVIKGICTGVLMDVVLVDCVIVQSDR